MAATPAWGRAVVVQALSPVRSAALSAIDSAVTCAARVGGRRLSGSTSDRSSDIVQVCPFTRSIE
jgi:hypothetical protein